MQSDADRNESPEKINPDRRIDVVLADHNALRAEMTGRINIQNTLVGTGLTAIGVTIGFAIAGDGDRDLLMLVPIVSAVILLLISSQSYRIIAIGDYIGTVQAKYLCETAGDASLPLWESRIQQHRAGRPGFMASILDAPVDLLLTVASVVSVVRADDTSWGLRIVALLAVILAIGIHLHVGFRGKLFTRFRGR